MKHPGSPNLYDTSKTVAEGGMPFRANFGVEYQGKNLLSEGSWSKGSEIEDGYPEFTADMLKQLGWWDDLTAEEKTAAEGKNWKTDLSGGIQRVAIKHGCAPYGNGKARCVVWNFPDPVPIHREPLYTLAARPGGEVPDLRGPQALLAPAHALHVDPGQGLLRRTIR